MNYQHARQTAWRIQFETRMRVRIRRPRQLDLPFPPDRYIGQS